MKQEDRHGPGESGNSAYSFNSYLFAITAALEVIPGLFFH